MADGARDLEIMEALGIQEDDIAIISLAKIWRPALSSPCIVRQLKVKNIIVSAPNEEYKLILEKVGATDVIIPEMAVAKKVAKSIISPNMMDYIPLSEDYIISEMAPPNSFLGKTIRDLGLRAKYHIEVIAVRDVISDNVHMVPHADFVIKDGEFLLSSGRRPIFARSNSQESLWAITRIEVQGNEVHAIGQNRLDGVGGWFRLYSDYSFTG